ncbi:MAG: hypothetical protein GF353_28385 [Candidatus Lokiarchaeota archaeon]|nr:hypothetical protein [Candidatus Lokiarchaeota archaeon]
MANNDEIAALIAAGVLAIIGAGVYIFLKDRGNNKEGDIIELDENEEYIPHDPFQYAPKKNEEYYNGKEWKRKGKCRRCGKVVTNLSVEHYCPHCDDIMDD